MKTVLFVPGFRQGMRTHHYAAVLHLIESKGYHAEFVSIAWRRTTIDDWVRQLQAVYVKYSADETILAGFSYGAMTAFAAAAQRIPAALWLFSLSPYFSDDLAAIKKSDLRTIGTQRVAAFEKLDFSSLAVRITCPTLIMAGSVELANYPSLQRRINIAQRLIKHTHYSVVDGASHDVTDSRYVQAIEEYIR